MNRPQLIVSGQTVDIAQMDFERAGIQKDFQSLSLENMTYDQAAMMIIDHALISDPAILYFLPRLSYAVFYEGANEMLLQSRLELLNMNSLTFAQQTTLKQLIKALKNLQIQREIEE